MIKGVNGGPEGQRVDAPRGKPSDAASPAEPRFIDQAFRFLVVIAIRIAEAAQRLADDQLKRFFRVSNLPARGGRVEAVQVRVGHRVRADLEILGEMLYLFGGQAFGRRELAGLRGNVEGCPDSIASEQAR